MCENICNSRAEVEPLVRACTPSTLPLSLLDFWCLTTPSPHSGVSPSRSLPTSSECPLVLTSPGCSCVWKFECVSTCTHAHRMAGLSHDWIHNSSNFSTTALSSCPSGTTGRCLELPHTWQQPRHSPPSTPCLFFFSFPFFFYCYNTTLLSYSPPFMAINTQCRGCIKSSQDFGSGVFITIPFSTLRTYKQA